MKDAIFTEEFEIYAVEHPKFGKPRRGDGGCFQIPVQNQKGKKVNLFVMAHVGKGWDHVSVTHPRRRPNWQEMEFVKRMFFEDDEIAFQFHLPIGTKITSHDYCLHLWRPQLDKMPLPDELKFC